MLSRVFHDWERRLAAAAEHRLVRPFEWGLDWIDGLGVGVEPEVERLAAWASQTVSNSDAFFALPPSDDYTLERRSAVLSERRSDAARGEQHRARAVLSGRVPSAAGGAPWSCCRSGTPTPRGTSGCAGC